ncbi:MAG TPA: hypothetical protein P5294_00225 [Smithellaceae bacterium]|nr:hypothetical protein [Smithellaceae bacterium]HRS88287.1 hypothetical protein [Smithellaceae bacterium]HRV24932.1 hypothetical protein [Smithellaceae bacterium]
MPIELKYLDEGRGVEYFVTGVLTGDDIIKANRLLYSSSLSASLKYKIIDRTQCTDYHVRADDVRLIAEQEKEAAINNPHLIIALIAPTKVQFAMSRMFKSYLEAAASGYKTEIFNNRKSAQEWVNKQLKSSLKKAD